jgi:hypothetical protein
MIGGGAFILLKSGREPAESSKQAEIGLAHFAKTLLICLLSRRD